MVIYIDVMGEDCKTPWVAMIIFTNVITFELGLYSNLIQVKTFCSSMFFSECNGHFDRGLTFQTYLMQM